MTPPDSSAADARGHELAMGLRMAYAMLRRQSNQVFESFGMTTDQYVLLTALARQGETTQQSLVSECASDTATLGAMVSLLEAKGLLKRVPHPRDGRAWHVRITPSGRTLVAHMRRRSEPLRRKLAGLFKDSESTALLEYLGRLGRALQPARRRRQPAPRRMTEVTAGPRQRVWRNGRAKPRAALTRAQQGPSPDFADTRRS